MFRNDFMETESRLVLLEEAGSYKNRFANEQDRTSGVWEYFKIMVMFAQLCKFIKNHCMQIIPPH